MRIKKTAITIPLLITFLLLAVIFFFTNSKSTTNVKEDTLSNVSVENGIQVIEVVANSKGYSPRETNAQSGIETVLRVLSQGTYGCERSLRIPDLDITKVLPTEGNTDISLGIPKKGENIFGSCSMGMYTFEINFN